MSSGKVGVDYTVTFAVRTGSGAPRTGLVAGNFTVTVRNPADDASTAPAVSEVSGGMYRFTIPNAFTTAEGVGEYGWTVELTLAPLDLIAGTVPFHLRDHDDLAQPGDAMALTAAAIDLIWDEPQAGHVTGGTFGLFLDTLISSRSSHSAADVDTVLTAAHGPGGWLTAVGFAVAGDAMALTAAAIDAIWDELLAGHVIVGSAGEALAAAAAGASPGAVADAVWDELQAGHVTASTFGAFLNAAIASRQSEASAASRAATDVAEHNTTQADIAALQDLSAAQAADAVWDELRAGHAVPDSFAESIRLDAAGLQTDAVNEIRDAILAATVDSGDGGVDLVTALRLILSMAQGRFVETDISATIKDFQFFERDDASALFTLRITAGAGRERTVG